MASGMASEASNRLLDSTTPMESPLTPRSNARREQLAAEERKLTEQRDQLAEQQRALDARLAALRFEVQSDVEMSASEKEGVAALTEELGVTPRGTITAEGVRTIEMFKSKKSDMLGIVFHSTLPAGLKWDSDHTPRVPSYSSEPWLHGAFDRTPLGAPHHSGWPGQSSVRLAIVDTIMEDGLAYACTELAKGDQSAQEGLKPLLA